VLTRRFVVLETLTGVQEPGKAPQYLRVANSIKIKIRLDPKEPEQIFPPYLEISYMEQDVALIESQRFLKISFTSEYFSDTSGFWSLMGTCFGIVITMLVVALMAQLVVTQMQERLETDDNARMGYIIEKFVFSAIELFSYLMFWLMVLATGGLFIFFKFQERVYLLMPGLDSVEFY
jgi:meckelin